MDIQNRFVRREYCYRETAMFLDGRHVPSFFLGSKLVKKPVPVIHSLESSRLCKIDSDSLYYIAVGGI